MRKCAIWLSAPPPRSKLLEIDYDILLAQAERASRGCAGELLDERAECGIRGFRLAVIGWATAELGVRLCVGWVEVVGWIAGLLPSRALALPVCR